MHRISRLKWPPWPKSSGWQPAGRYVVNCNHSSTSGADHILILAVPALLDMHAKPASGPVRSSSHRGRAAKRKGQPASQARQARQARRDAMQLGTIPARWHFGVPYQFGVVWYGTPTIA